MAELASRRLTWSNALTALRLLAAPFFWCALVGDSIGLACGLFGLAVATDMADGRLARARGEVSAFGGLLDHATDASFVTLGLAALAARGIVPWALPALVAAAFVQYVLDSKSLAGRELQGSFLGRWNGILYFVPLGIFVTREALRLDWPSDLSIRSFALALVASTILSMAARARTLLRLRSRTDDSL